MSNYTSNLLCHFVGRAKPNDEERFNLLLSIVKGCELLCNINSPHNPQVTFFLTLNVNISVKCLVAAMLCAFATFQMRHWQSTRINIAISDLVLKRHLSPSRVHIL